MRYSSQSANRKKTAPTRRNTGFVSQSGFEVTGVVGMSPIVANGIGVEKPK